MQKLKKLLALPILAASLALTGVTGANASTMEDITNSGELRVAIQTQGPPVSFVDKHGERTGLAVEIVRMMAEDMGVELVLQNYDWQGLIPSLLSKKADLIAADMTPTPKRATRLLFTEPIFYTGIIGFTTDDKPYKHWEDLNKEGISIGATQASTYSEAARAKLPNASLKEYEGGTAATAQALSAGRIDAGISDSGTIKGFLKEFENFRVLEGTLRKEPLSFATRPESVHLLMWLDNYIRFIRHSGQLEELLEYWWHTTDWEADH